MHVISVKEEEEKEEEKEQGAREENAANFVREQMTVRTLKPPIYFLLFFC